MHASHATPFATQVNPEMFQKAMTPYGYAHARPGAKTLPKNALTLKMMQRGMSCSTIINGVERASLVVTAASSSSSSPYRLCRSVTSWHSLSTWRF